MLKLKQSFKLKLICIFVALLLIPMSMLGYLTYNKSKNIMFEEKTTAIQMVSQQVNATIEEFLQGNQDKIESISQNKGLIDLAQLTESNGFLEKARTLENAYVSEDNIVNTRLNMARESMKSLTLDEDVDTCYMAMCNKNMVSGKKQYIFNKTKSDTFDPTKREWYKNALESKGKVVWSEPYTDREKNTMMITLSKLVESNNKIYGVVAIDINLNKIINKISKLKVGNNGKTYIVHKGKYVFNCDNSLIGKSIEDKNLKELLSKSSHGIYDKGEFLSIFEKNKNTGWNIILSISKDELNSKSNPIKTFTLVIMFVFLIIGIFVSLLISNKILKSLENLNLCLKKASHGNLRVKSSVKSIDEFGQISDSFNKMINDINKSFKDIFDISNIILSNSEKLKKIEEQTKLNAIEVGNSINNISRESSNQSQQAINGKKKMMEFSTNLTDISSCIKDTNKLINNAQDSSNRGIGIIENLNLKTVDVIENNNNLMNVINNVNSSIKEINSMLDIIENITKETNLLSLNASIEAARAGEYGKGFAVVANEVKNLSQESNKSTYNIKKLIKDIETKSNNSIEAINHTSMIFKEYASIVKETIDIFNIITNKITEINNKITEVNNYNNLIIVNKENVENFIDNLSMYIDITSNSTKEISNRTKGTIERMNYLHSNIGDFHRLAKRLKEKIDSFQI